ncbi:hypothetical protein EHV15_36015 [Paenibacillus oralis]|uniref:Uncharacterized protein n=1 Tax=Paenibacillus oralis TaxID=2490856 RepID=A0A3P3TAD9_9BACL|nr:hypothetical protein EHV15_36015 [Paenibacillus oralis]
MAEKNSESGILTGKKVKVKIKCNNCGEKYTFRGIHTGEHIETGFKKCICGNEDDFAIKVI